MRTLLLLLLATGYLQAQNTTSSPVLVVGTDSAFARAGTFTTVCGQVFSTTKNTRLRGQPTYINFGDNYPNQTFTAVLWAQDRCEFSYDVLTYLRGKYVCITGMIVLHRGKPQIVLKKEGQIEVTGLPKQ